MSSETVNEPSVRQVTITICELCEQGYGGTCNVSGCAFWGYKAPVGIMILEPDCNTNCGGRAVPVEYNADLRLVLENWGVAIPSPEAEAAYNRVVQYNRRSGCYVT